MKRNHVKLTLMAITTQEAQWAGMAPKMAGGWVMNCEVGEMAMDRLLATDEKLALVPDWYAGREIDPVKALAALKEAIERTERRQWKRERITQDLATLRGWIASVELATV